MVNMETVGGVGILVGIILITIIFFMIKRGTLSARKFGKSQRILGEILREEEKLHEELKVNRSEKISETSKYAANVVEKANKLEEAILHDGKRFAHKKLHIAKHIIELLEQVSVSSDNDAARQLKKESEKVNESIETLKDLCEKESVRELFQDFQIEIEDAKKTETPLKKELLRLEEHQTIIVREIFAHIESEKKRCEAIKNAFSKLLEQDLVSGIFATGHLGRMQKEAPFDMAAKVSNYTKGFYAEVVEENRLWEELCKDETVKAKLLIREEEMMKKALKNKYFISY